MNWVNPGALWWLIPTFGAIILLYMLRMRRKDLKVPAVFLWPAQTNEVRANAFFQRLRWNPLMALQLLAVLLALLALARPQVRIPGLEGTITVFVVDKSASMGTQEGSTTRLGMTLDTAKKAIDAMKPGERIGIIEAGSRPRLVSSLSNDPSRLRGALGTIRLSDAPGDMGEALRLAAALVQTESSARIVLLSDGVFPSVPNFSPGKASLSMIPIGRAQENAGIVALGTQTGENGLIAYCGVKSFLKAKKVLNLDIRADGKLVHTQAITLDPLKEIGVSCELPKEAEIVQAKLREADALASDNVAYAAADPHASVRVLMVTSGSYFLERALSLDPRVQLDVAPRVPDSEAGSGKSEYDLVVFDGVSETKVKAPATLCFGSAGPASPVVRKSTASEPTEVAADEKHPLVQDIAWATTYIGPMEVVTPGSAARELVRSNKGPIVVTREVPKRQVYVAFRPNDSDFPLQVGFPIFTASALDFLVGRGAASTSAVTAGQSLNVPADEGAELLKLTAPDGQSALVSAVSGAYPIRTLERVGEYQAESALGKRKFLVSMLDASESDIRPREQVQVGTKRLTAQRAPQRNEDRWRWVALIALGVLAIEWWLFTRWS